MECAVSDCLQAVTTVLTVKGERFHRGQFFASLKSLCADGNQGFRNCDRFQILAIIERAIAQCSQLRELGKIHLGQCITAVKSTVVNVLQRAVCTAGDRGQRIAVLERGVADRLQVSCDGQINSRQFFGT